MSVRRVVEDFVALGPLPNSEANEELIAKHQAFLLRINKPVTDDEATLLIGAFGPDDCYGLAWTLLHLIESAPSGVPLATEPSNGANEWLQRLWNRSHH